jgi:hypothetical protein
MFGEGPTVSLESLGRMQFFKITKCTKSSSCLTIYGTLRLHRRVAPCERDFPKPTSAVHPSPLLHYHEDWVILIIFSYDCPLRLRFAPTRSTFLSELRSSRGTIRYSDTIFREVCLLNHLSAASPLLLVFASHHLARHLFLPIDRSR